MKTIHKFLISLLLSVVLLGIFIVLGYTGLFETIETKFYNQRIIDNKRERIDDVYSLFKIYNDENIKRLKLILNNDSFLRVFELNQLASDITDRNYILGSLEDELKGFQYLRIVDFKADSQKIHYSSDVKDIRSASTTRIIYDLWRNSDDFIENQVFETSVVTLQFDGENNSILYKIPVKDSLGLVKGVALVYFSSSGFKEYLFSKGLSSSNSLVQLLGKSGIIIDLKEEQLEIVSERLLEIKNSNMDQPHLVSSNIGNDRFFVLNKNIIDYDLIPDLSISIVIKESELELNSILVVVLLILSFSTFFLFFFLILNIRQDRSVIIASRIKKFQLNFLIEYLDNKIDLDWDLWERDMRSKRDQVRKEFKKGLGRFQKEEEDRIDELIDNNWDEIITVLSKKKEEKEESKEFDLKKIEQILQKALKNVNFTITNDNSTRVSPNKGEKEQIPVEDLSDEEGLDDLEDLGEPIEVEDLSDKEGLDDLEDLGEPIEVEDLSDEEGLDDLEDLGEPIEVEDLSNEECLDDLEDLGEPIEVEDLSDEEGLEDLEDLGEPIEVEDLSDEEGLEDLEDLGEPIEVEDLSDEEGLDDLEDLEEPIEVEDLSDDESLDDVEDLSDEEDLNDLEDLGESVTTEELEELLPHTEYDELPLIHEEELETIPVFDGSEEALLVDVKSASHLLDIIDMSGLSINKDDSEYYSDIGDLEELSIDIESVDDRTTDLNEDFEDLEVIEDLEILEELDDVEELDEVDELVELTSFFEELPYDLFYSPENNDRAGSGVSTQEEDRDSLKAIVSSVVENDIEDEVDFVHVYSDDLLPQFVSDEKDDRVVEQTFRDSVFRAIAEGFDFDSYASSKKDEYKALISITREINAVGGIIYVGQEAEYSVELSLGIGSDLILRLKKLLLTDNLAKVTGKRNLIFIHDTQHGELHDFIRDADRRFLKSILYVPVFYNKKAAYLFLGFKKSTTDIEQLLKSIS